MTHSQLHLPDSELEIIRILWQKGTATTTEIREALNAERKEPLAHSTVVTLVQRLENRKYVEKTGAQKGKSFVYRAVLARKCAKIPDSKIFHAFLWQPDGSRYLSALRAATSAETISKKFEIC